MGSLTQEAQLRLAALPLNELTQRIAELQRQLDAAASHIVDMRATLARLDGDVELLRDLLGFFFADTPTLIERAAGALERGEADELRHAAHRLKGLIGNFDARAAVDAAAHLELLARDRALAEAATAFEHLQRRIEELETALSPLSRTS